jgi:hypothetical protein
MARKMKQTKPPQPSANVLVIEVDPLAVALGHRVMPRGGIHGSGKRPSRAKAKKQWRRQLTSDDRGCRAVA